MFVVYGVGVCHWVSDRSVLCIEHLEVIFLRFTVKHELVKQIRCVKELLPADKHMGQEVSRSHRKSAGQVASLAHTDTQ